MSFKEDVEIIDSVMIPSLKSQSVIEAWHRIKVLLEILKTACSFPVELDMYDIVEAMRSAADEG